MRLTVISVGQLGPLRRFQASEQACALICTFKFQRATAALKCLDMATPKLFPHLKRQLECYEVAEVLYIYTRARNVIYMVLIRKFRPKKSFFFRVWTFEIYRSMAHFHKTIDFSSFILLELWDIYSSSESLSTSSFLVKNP